MIRILRRHIPNQQPKTGLSLFTIIMLIIALIIAITTLGIAIAGLSMFLTWLVG